MELCIECKKRHIHIKKRGLCAACYQRFIKRNGPVLKGNPESIFTVETSKQHQHGREVEFVRNFFDHSEWIYNPAVFRFDGDLYSPDFYDAKRNVFIEVSGSRQAYHKSKGKYARFRKSFPEIKLEIRKPSGLILNEETKDKNWEQHHQLF